MGHKGSHVHSGAVGLEGKFRAPAEIDAGNMMEALQETENLELREKAQEHTDTAVEALRQVAAAGESEPARVSAARALLDYGHGKPAQQHIHRGSGAGGITINIYRLSTGEKTQHTFDTIAQDVEDAKQVGEVIAREDARKLLEQGE